MEERILTPEEKQAKEYEKFKNKVKRLTPYAHDKRMFSRMEAAKVKEEISNKKKAFKNKKDEDKKN